MNQEYIKKLYGKSVRLRVCGLYIENNALLMVKHTGLGPKNELWIPPGGGVEFGQSLEENLEREFLEETGLKIRVDDFLFIYEYQNHPLHAIEIFFSVCKIAGSVMKGVDPEYPKEEQIIDSVKMLPFTEIESIQKEKLHGIFTKCSKASDVINKRGFFKFENYA